MSEPTLDDSPPAPASGPASCDADPLGAADAAPPVDDPAPTAGGTRRSVVEFLVLLLAGMLTLRYFVAEAYVVPTGSMAPTILGFHAELECPNCHDRFAVGVDEAGRLAGRPVCPNCGQDGIDPTRGIEAGGDRLLVQKFLFDLRPPRRWEVAVFQSPIDAGQAYVKRIVGLPGEAVQLIDGDVWIDGTVARKSWADIRATRIPVFDNAFQPADAARFPRWTFRATRTLAARRPVPSGWTPQGSGFVHQARVGTGVDWAEYRHWDPERGRFGAIHDSYAYNGGDHGGDHVVRDVSLSCEVSARPDVESVEVRLVHGADVFVVDLPVDPREGRRGIEVSRNGRLLEVTGASGGLRSSPAHDPRWDLLEVAVVDQRISVALGGEPMCDPIDYQAGGSSLASTVSPVALGVVGGGLAVRDVRVYRDIYYTGDLTLRSRRPSAVDEPFFLGADEYFVLGDNSPVSNDSRFWDARPVVHRSRFLGKPFLVHLPGQAWGIRIWGRELGWIPDFREIRYIR